MSCKDKAKIFNPSDKILEEFGKRPLEPFQRNVRCWFCHVKKNESIVINDDITVVVVEIRGDKVRLGIEAPKEVPVHRREVYDAIKRTENESQADA